MNFRRARGYEGVKGGFTTMLPVVEPLAGLSAPVALGLAWLGAVAVAGATVLLARLAAADRRPSRPRAAFGSLAPRLARAA
jgi:hypothetical protein